MVSSDFPYQKELLLKEKICSHREVPIMKRDAIKRTTACSSSHSLMCVTFSAFWLPHWVWFVRLYVEKFGKVGGTERRTEKPKVIFTISIKCC